MFISDTFVRNSKSVCGVDWWWKVNLFLKHVVNESLGWVVQTMLYWNVALVFHTHSHIGTKSGKHSSEHFKHQKSKSKKKQKKTHTWNTLRLFLQRTIKKGGIASLFFFFLLHRLTCCKLNQKDQLFQSWSLAHTNISKWGAAALCPSL